MFAYLFLLFTLVPLIELFLLIKIGTVIGAMNTVALVVLTGVLGAYLARSQGLMIVNRINHELARGSMPSDAMFDGVLILVGGVLLITPGVFTDIIGFFLLLPFGRSLIKRWIKHRIEREFKQGKTIHIRYFGE